MEVLRKAILLTGKCVSSPWKDVRFAGKFFFIPVSFEGPLFMLFGCEILRVILLGNGTAGKI